MAWTRRERVDSSRSEETLTESKNRRFTIGSLPGILAWRAASRIGKELPFLSATEAAARVSTFDGVQHELRLDCFADELPHGDSVSKRGVR